MSQTFEDLSGFTRNELYLMVNALKRDVNCLSTKLLSYELLVQKYDKYCDYLLTISGKQLNQQLIDNYMKQINDFKDISNECCIQLRKLPNDLKQNNVSNCCQRSDELPEVLAKQRHISQDSVLSDDNSDWQSVADDYISGHSDDDYNRDVDRHQSVAKTSQPEVSCVAIKRKAQDIEPSVTSKPVKRYKCLFNLCENIRFDTLDEFHKHTDDIHLKYVCNGCDQRFGAQPVLNSHQLSCKPKSLLKTQSTKHNVKSLTKQTGVELIPESIQLDKPIVLSNTAMFATQGSNELNVKKVYQLFMCHWIGCQKAFVSKNHLDCHLKTHTTTSDSQDIRPTIGQELDKWAPTTTTDPLKTQRTNEIQNMFQRINEIIDSNNKVLNNEKHFNPTVGSNGRMKCLLNDCHYITNARNGLFRHMKSEHNIDNIYECSQKSCNVLHLTMDDMKAHINYSHSKNGQFDCLFAKCKQHFPSGDELVKHIRDKHSNNDTKIYRCDYQGCGKVVTGLRPYHRHQMVHQKDKLFKCTVDGCDYQCIEHKSYESHMNRHKGLKPYACDQEGCDEAFAGKDSLKYHKNVCHNKTQIELFCDYPDCGKRFISKLRFDAHKLVHVVGYTPPVHKCKYQGCGEAFNALNVLQCHIRTVHGPRYIPCQWPGCQFKTIYSSVLKHHVSRVHSDDRPFPCEYPGCKWAFKIKPDLTRHMVVHSDVDGQHPCTVPGCLKVFKSMTLLYSHRTQHHSKRQHPCEWPGCAYVGKNKHAHTKHLMTHQSERPYACNWPGCEYTCKHKNLLKLHEATHTDDRPFVCDWPDCGRRCKSKIILKRHLVVHSEVMYPCDWIGCQFKTKHRYDLKSHKLKVHQNNKITKKTGKKVK